MAHKEIIGNAELWLGDCYEILPSISGFECIVTDPPYGIAMNCNYRERGRGKLGLCNDYPDVIGDDVPFDPSAILALGVPTILFGANYFADKLPPSSGWLVWDKERPDGLDQSTCELAWTNYVKGVRRFRYLWNGMMRAGERGENYHSTQKPVALMEWILTLKWTPEGAVLDPFMGSGSIGVACMNLGRRYIGIEIDNDYFDVACRRIDNAQRQQRMFA